MATYKLTEADVLKAAAARRLNKSPSGLISAAQLSLTPTVEAAIEKRLAEMPVTCRKGYLRAMGGKRPRAAIKAFCLECICWVRSEVAMCTSPACPLYPYRPFQE